MSCWCVPGQYLGCGDVLPAEPLSYDAALLHLEAPASPPPASALPPPASAFPPSASDPEPKCRQVPVLEQ
jgi:hypothetical protein